jgi:choline monooxygenase
MVFVNLTPEGPAVRDYLGPLAAEIEAHFCTHEPFVTQDTVHDANWKIAIENAVESYHVPLVHPNTFGDYLAEELHDHRLGANYSSYQGKAPPRPRTMRDRLFSASMHLLYRQPVSWEYMHTHVFPTYCISYGGHSCELMTVEPLGPTRSRRVAVAFMPRDIRRWPVAKVLSAAYKRGVNRFSEKLLREDSGVWESVQRGVETTSHPGVLSAREERVYHFQKYVAEKVSTFP